MQARVPLTLITGFLGSGKTTLLRHILAERPQKLALIVNEFGELGIDSKVLEGKNVRMTELMGGCVCCSLVGEFEAAINEILETIKPERIVVETTGLAEPEALLFNIEEDLPQVRLDGVVTVVDAEALGRFPQLGQTTRMQIESADLLLLNKADLVEPGQLAPLKAKLSALNPTAPISETCYCKIAPDVLFGWSRGGAVLPSSPAHQPEFQTFTWRSDKLLEHQRLKPLVEGLAAKGIYRAKGFVHSAQGGFLFNYVAGRWDLEQFDTTRTELVFIGQDILKHRSEILAMLE